MTSPTSPQPAQKLDLSVPLEQIGIYALPLVIFWTVIPAVAYLLLNGTHQLFDTLSISYWAWSLLVVPLGIMFHELLHAIGFVLFGNKRWSDIAFGFDKKSFAVFAHCKQPIQARAYKGALWLPGVALGLLPLLCATVAADVGLWLFGWFFTTSAVGDMLIAAMIWKVPPHLLVSDHPSQAGCIVRLKHPETVAPVSEENLLKMGKRLNAASIFAAALFVAKLLFDYTLPDDF